MEGVDSKLVRQLFYGCAHHFYERDEKIFSLGEPCDNIIIVMSGVLDIIITDGRNYEQTLDVLGPGSILGQNFVLKGEKWPYHA